MSLGQTSARDQKTAREPLRRTGVCWSTTVSLRAFDSAKASLPSGQLRRSNTTKRQRHWFHTCLPSHAPVRIQ